MPQYSTGERAAQTAIAGNAIELPVNAIRGASRSFNLPVRHLLQRDAFIQTLIVPSLIVIWGLTTVTIAALI